MQYIYIVATLTLNISKKYANEHKLSQFKATRLQVKSLDVVALFQMAEYKSVKAGKGRRGSSRT